MSNLVMKFTPEEDARLRALISERLGAREIAAALDSEGFPTRTRNAILGRVRRLGLRLDTRDARVKRGDEPKKKARFAPAALKPAPAPEPAPETDLLVFPPPDRPGIAFLAAREGQCRFPLWAHDARPAADKLFVCGEPVKPGQSYCPACYAQAYQARPLANLARHAASFARHDGTLRRAPARERAA